MIKKGTALKPSPIIAAKYRRAIVVILRAMHKSVMRELTRSIKSSASSGGTMEAAPYSADFQAKTKELRGKYDVVLERLGAVAASEWMDAQVKFSASSFISSIHKMVDSSDASLSLKGSIVNEGNIAFVEEKIAENVSLIKSVGTKYFDRVEKEVMLSISGKTQTKGLASALQGIGGMSERQADLIARDQTSKIYGQIQTLNMNNAGLTRAKWMHSAAGRDPRSYHARKWDGKSEPPNGLDGYIYDINNPPIIDLKTGERGIPGQLINCRCFSVPVLDI